jgi:YD repeat-containing protein
VPLTQEQSCEAASQPGVLGKHPIEYFSGQKVKSQLDYEDFGAFPLSVVRYYRSGDLLAQNASTGGATPVPSPAQTGLIPIALGWRFLLGASLRQTAEQLPPGNTGELKLGAHIDIHSDGSSEDFHRQLLTLEQSVYASKSEHDQGQLIQTGNTLTYSRANDSRRWQFDANTSRLLQEQDASGQTHSYSYNSAGQVQSISDGFGRSLLFSYTSAGQIASITTPDAQTITYSYDAQNRLSGVTYPSSGSSSGGSTSTTITYHYEDSRFPNALTGITDEAGIRWQSYAYDAQGRAISSQLAGGAEHYQVAYTTAPATSTSPATITAAAVTDALGTVRSYQYGMAAGRLAVLSASSASEDPNKDSAATRSQGAAGTIDSQTDFLGVQTQYQYDGLPAGSAAGAYSRRLLTQSTRAAGQPEEQSTRTQWHPSYNLPLETIEAGRTAGSGAALADLRKTTYSYNSAGQIQSIHTQDLQNPNAPAQTISLTWYGDNPADPAAFKGLLKSTSTAAAGTTTSATSPAAPTPWGKPPATATTWLGASPPSPPPMAPKPPTATTGAAGSPPASTTPQVLAAPMPLIPLAIAPTVCCKRPPWPMV